ncbi:unnamed protein product, partial [Didymodactylos carnosus]
KQHNEWFDKCIDIIYPIIEWLRDYQIDNVNELIFDLQNKNDKSTSLIQLCVMKLANKGKSIVNQILEKHVKEQQMMAQLQQQSADDTSQQPVMLVLLQQRVKWKVVI